MTVLQVKAMQKTEAFGRTGTIVWAAFIHRALEKYTDAME